MIHSAPLPPWPGRSVDVIAQELDRECDWLVTNGVLPAELVNRNRRIAEAALRPWRPVFIHGDLQVTHVFVEGDEVTGVIDWSEAAQGDGWVVARLPLGDRVVERRSAAANLAPPERDHVGDPCALQNGASLIRVRPAMPTQTSAETDRPGRYRSQDLRSAAKLTITGQITVAIDPHHVLEHYGLGASGHADGGAAGTELDLVADQDLSVLAGFENAG
jgi:hypothetical protein